MLFVKIEFGVFDVIGYFVGTLISFQHRFSSIISLLAKMSLVHLLPSTGNSKSEAFTQFLDIISSLFFIVNFAGDFSLRQFRIFDTKNVGI